MDVCVDDSDSSCAALIPQYGSTKFRSGTVSAASAQNSVRG